MRTVRLYVFLTICAVFLSPSHARSDTSACKVPLLLRDGVKLADDAKRLVSGFSRTFCHKQGKPLVATSGLRTPRHQAKLMLKRLEQGDTLSYYQNQKAAAEILDVFQSAKSKGQNALKPLGDLIEDQVNRDCFISKHLFSRAVDIAKHDSSHPLSAKDEATLMSLAKEHGVLVIANEGGRTDHLHLNFPPYPHDPRNCPKEKGYRDANREDLRLVAEYDDGPERPKREVMLHKEAAKALKRLQYAAKKDGITLHPLSGFRSVYDQNRIFKLKVAAVGKERAKLSVKQPGRSEHHTGYAIDFGYPSGETWKIGRYFLKLPAYNWLVKNAGKFDFEISYPKNNTLNVNFEPWHWRYIGSQSARRKLRLSSKSERRR